MPVNSPVKLSATETGIVKLIEADSKTYNAIAGKLNKEVSMTCYNKVVTGVANEI